MIREKKFFILYNADKVVAEGIQCEILIDGKPATSIDEVAEHMNEHQFIHILNNNDKNILINTWNVLKVRYYERK